MREWCRCVALSGGVLMLVMQKSPHSQSYFKAFQTLSQQIANMVESYPTVSFQSLVVGLL
jgi:hypothetical protein